MPHINIEIKAKCSDPNHVRKIFTSLHAEFKGVDHQVDTYFNVSSGRLKLREGNIENNLIHYHREDLNGPKQSRVTLFTHEPEPNLKKILTDALGVLTTIDKQREIYFIENVKFHLDDVRGLGSFVEIEAIDQDGSIGEKKLREQCDFYLKTLNIQEEDLLANSYSDLLLARV